MNKIPPDLVKALTKLGLLESEAKIYVSLVMMNSSEVKELIDFTGISKPNAYEGLRSLEELGLINAVSERPIVYQAVAPEMGLEMLIDAHLKAKKDAAKLFSVLSRNIRELHDENLWFIFTDKNLDYKIMDMIRNAKKSIIFGASEKYIKYLKPLARKDLDVEVTIITDQPEAGLAVRKTLSSSRANVHIIDRANPIRVFSVTKAMNQEAFVPAFQNIFDVLNYENMLILVVDDADFLYVPPFFGDSMTAMSSKNSLLIDNMKIVYQAMLAFLTERSKKE
jgi:HTH-type transcriptional regulator, sugar sensing transcriptional regulator